MVPFHLSFFFRLCISSGVMKGIVITSRSVKFWLLKDIANIIRISKIIVLLLKVAGFWERIRLEPTCKQWLPPTNHSNLFAAFRRKKNQQKITTTVRLLTHVLCKTTHFFFHSFIATMSYSLQISFKFKVMTTIYNEIPLKIRQGTVFRFWINTNFVCSKW